MSVITFEQAGVNTTNSAAINTTNLQNAIDEMSDAGGGILVMSNRYRVNGNIQAKSSVKICGNLLSNGKGSVDGKGSWFVIEDETNTFIKLGNANLGVQGFGIFNVGFDYINQPLNTTNISNLIQYPTSIKGEGNTFDITLKNLVFVGAWTMIEFTSVNGAANADIDIDHVYGFPLSGRGIYMDNVLDISRITNCLFSPGVGNYQRPAGQVPSIISSQEVMRYVMNQPLAFIEGKRWEQFFISKNFAFCYPTFIKMEDAYGTLHDNPTDIGRVSYDLNCVQPSRSILVSDTNQLIGSGGDNIAERNMIIIRGSGFYSFTNITPKLGQTSFGIQPSGANNNSFMKILNNGTPYVSINNIKGKTLTGTYTFDIQNLNSNTVFDVRGMNIIDAQTKITGPGIN